MAGVLFVVRDSLGRLLSAVALMRGTGGAFTSREIYLDIDMFSVFLESVRVRESGYKVPCEHSRPGSYSSERM